MGSSAQGLLKIPPHIYSYDGGDDPPASILLDPYGYLSCRTNGTTAESLTRDGRTIQVTFWVASPPRVSSFSIHCPDFQPSMYSKMPRAICSEDDHVLFRFPIVTTGHPDNDDDDDEHHIGSEDDHCFVYQAGTKNNNTPPSLHLVPPIPHHLEFNDREAVLLRCRGDDDQDMFYMAVLARVFHFKYDDKQYNLHLYNSKTGGWSTKLTKIDYSYTPKERFNFAYPNAVLTIGGESGSVGWVDLWHGILICDFLRLPEDNDDHCRLRYIPLLLPPVPKPLRGYASYSRNVIVFGDHIKFFEIVRVRPAGSCAACTAQSLVAATKKMKISDIGSGNNNWEEEEDCSSIKFSEIPVDSLKFAQMLPRLKLQLVTGTTKLTLKGLSAGYPALSMQDADVVYIMQTPNLNKDKASVIAVDMRNKAIKDMAYFDTGRYLGYCCTYLQSGISKYLNI